MENNYLIPANANKGKLIMGLFRPFDFMLFGAGAGITLLLLLVFQSYMTQISVAVLTMLPVLITGFLVIPVPHYHNVLQFLVNVYKISTFLCITLYT